MKLVISALIFASLFSSHAIASETQTSRIIKLPPKQKEQTQEPSGKKLELNELTPKERVDEYRRIVRVAAGKLGMPDSKL